MKQAQPPYEKRPLKGLFHRFQIEKLVFQYVSSYLQQWFLNSELLKRGGRDLLIGPISKFDISKSLHSI
jgi:hypothetical protein